MDERKPVTIKDIELIAKYRGVTLQLWQKELIAKYLNGEKPLFFMPRRGDGWSLMRMQMLLLAEQFRLDQITQKE